MDYQLLIDKVLDKTGLKHFWDIIKQHLDKITQSIAQLEQDMIEKIDDLDVTDQIKTATADLISYQAQEPSEDEQTQARENIGVEYAADEEVLAVMAEIDAIPAIQTETGALLSSDENTVLTV